MLNIIKNIVEFDEIYIYKLDKITENPIKIKDENFMKFFGEIKLIYLL